MTSPTSASDLAVYQRLVAMSEELERLASGCSQISEAALQTAAINLRGMASVIYEHALSQDP